MKFTCHQGWHQHHSEDAANHCQPCATATRAYFKRISDNMLRDQGHQPIPNDYRGDRQLIQLAENALRGVATRLKRRAVLGVY